MKTFLVTMMAAPAIFAASGAAAWDRPAPRGPIVPIANGGGGARIVPLVNGGHFRDGGMHRGRFRRGHFTNFIVVEREVPVIIGREMVREVVREVAPPAPPPPPPPPRKPYVIGKSYASLPGGCIKMIEGGVSYYWCSGEWYRQVGRQYRAVKREL